MMRMIGSEKGYYITNENHIADTYSEKYKAKFVVCNTDGGTGRENGIPQNRNKKGPGSERDIAGNQEHFEFFGDIVEFSQAAPAARGAAVWCVCIYCNNDKIRAELSCPVKFENGLFAAFYERLNLTGNGFGDDPVRSRKNSPSDGDSGFEIPVTRKQA